jgi:hypothetical protein
VCADEGFTSWATAFRSVRVPITDSKNKRRSLDVRASRALVRLCITMNLPKDLSGEVVSSN